MKIVKKPDSNLEAVRIAKVGVYEHNRLLLSVTEPIIPLWLLQALTFNEKKSGTGINICVKGDHQLHALDYVVKEDGIVPFIRVYSTQEFNNKYSIIEEEK